MYDLPIAVAEHDVDWVGEPERMHLTSRLEHQSLPLLQPRDVQQTSSALAARARPAHITGDDATADFNQLAHVK